MSTSKETEIGQLVAEDFRTAAVFSSYGIDFCCNGNISLEEVCKKKGIELDEILDRLKESVAKENDVSINFQSLPLNILADYIENTHHRYVEEKLPILSQYLVKLCKVHGERHPELHEIYQLFSDLAGELSQHMKKEEIILFPFIRKMVKKTEQNQKVEPPHFGTVKNPIAMMEFEHDNAGEIFRHISFISNEYMPPEDACNTYKVAFSMLKEFEQDLHKHIHLENNILFPRALKMEQEMVQETEGSFFMEEDI